MNSRSTQRPSVWLRYYRFLLILAALLGGIGVLLGAFGAHGLEPVLTLEGMEVYRTGVDYHFIHVLGMLLALSMADQRIARQHAVLSAALMAIGILLFSGSLYVLAVTGTSWIGMITPVGGMAFFGGWIALAIGVAQFCASTD